jgi:hypothetical protein
LNSKADAIRTLIEAGLKAEGRRVTFIDVCQTYAAMCRAEGK